MKAAAIYKAARDFGLLRLSRKTGFARSYLYKVVNGTSNPSIDALEKISDVLGFEIGFRLKPLNDSVESVSRKVSEGQDWKIYYFNFVDTFRRTKDERLIHRPPIKKLGKKEKALLASITLELCQELEVKVPTWAKQKLTLEKPWFVSGVESLKAMALVESPASFKINNIFVLENFLNRA